MKIYSVSLVISEIQIKNQSDLLRHSFKKMTTLNAGKDVEQLNLSCITGENAKWHRHSTRRNKVTATQKSISKYL